MLITVRARETTTTIGTGTLNLNGAAAGAYQSIGTSLGGTTSSVPYVLADPTNNQFEEGFGTYTSGVNTLSRDRITFSTNPNNPINLTGATCDIFVGFTSSFANWGMTKESLDTGEALVIPANYQMSFFGPFSMNGGTLDLYGDWMHS
jgi:hypothetical protein